MDINNKREFCHSISGIIGKINQFKKGIQHIKLDIEESLTEINIFATKTHKARTIYVKEATHYLILLKKQQKELGIWKLRNFVKKPIE